MAIKIRKGLDIPLAGEPEQIVHDASGVGSVALLGADYIDMRAHLLVEEGERVRLGQPLFTDRHNPALRFTSPGSGVVRTIARGEKRRLASVVIQLEGDEDEEETFNSYEPAELSGLTGEQVRENLVASGAWTAFRTRPFSKVPAPDAAPHSIFVTAIDTNPLALRPEIVIRQHAEAFGHGLQVISRLTEGPVFVCIGSGWSLDTPLPQRGKVVEFQGPHPAGLVGTHIHFLDPVGLSKTVWHLGYQDVIAIGKLFTSGRLWVERTIALAGPLVREPRLLRTRQGAAIDDLTDGEIEDVRCRVISGSVLGGRRAAGPIAYLGRYHTQVCVLREDDSRRLLAWLSPGLSRYSMTNLFVSSMFRPGARYSLDTRLNGARRALVPIGTFERVMPLDILPTLLLRHLLVGDTETAIQLGCLELDEEDLALCSFVCPSKYDYGPILRANLAEIEREG